MIDSNVSVLAVIGTNLFAGTWDDGVFLSTDNGGSWRAVNTGLTSSDVQALAVIGTNLYAGTQSNGTGGGVFLSTNNGTSWTAINNGLENTGLSGYHSVSSFAISGTNLFAGCEPDIQGSYLGSNVNSGVFLSTNNGTNWTAVNTGLPDTAVYSLMVSGTNLFAGTSGDGVWRRPLSEMIASNVVSSNESVVALSMTQNYPNPFSQSTTISFISPDRGPAQVTVVNLLSAEVARLFSGELEMGEHSFTWDAQGMTPGIYECVVRMNGREEEMPMMLMH